MAATVADGGVIWDFNTLRDFPTVNGAKALRRIDERFGTSSRPPVG
jgi:hypothetical protein